MYFDLERQDLAAAQLRHTWTILLPFFNERDYLVATVTSLANQSRAAKLILIDNGSTDDGAKIVRAACDRLGFDYLLVTEPRPGKVAALQQGLGWVRSPYVATCDADTIYPPDYLAAAERLLAQDDCVVAGAYFVAPDGSDRAARAVQRLKTAQFLPRQCHSGGAGQAFRTDILRAVGGFDTARWNFVLEDHEVIHRMMRRGAMRYAQDLWCIPSQRDRDRGSIRWTWLERMLYSATAPWAGDWFFYRFLAARLRRRRLLSNCIREAKFQVREGTVFATSYPVR